MARHRIGTQTNIHNMLFINMLRHTINWLAMRGLWSGYFS